MQDSDTHEKNDRTILALTFHPYNIRVKNIMYKHFHILQDSNETTDIFRQLPITAWRKDTNLTRGSFCGALTFD